MLIDQSPINSIECNNQRATNTRPPTIDAVDILGVDVAKLTVDQLHNWIGYYIQNNQKELILNVNVHCMNLCFQNSWLQSFLRQAPIIFCDGAGIMLSARLLGDHIPQRITYADWMWQLGAFAEERGYSFYFVGGRPGVAEKAAQRLQAKYPALQIAGTHHGYVATDPNDPANQQLIAEINAAAPNILVLGMGMPHQERWLLENWRAVNANIALTGGAVFDYISGELVRAPQWMTNYGFEWMGRLLIEPRRLWKRYVIGNPRFFWRVLRYTMQNSGSRQSAKLNSRRTGPIPIE